MISIFCFAGILAFALISLLPQLPSSHFVWLGLGVSLILLLLAAFQPLLGTFHHRIGASQHRSVFSPYFPPPFLYFLLGFCLCFSYALYQAHHRLDQGLHAIHKSKVARVQLRVSSIALYTPEAIRFDAEVLHSTPAGGIPEIVRVRWPLDKFTATKLTSAQIIPATPTPLSTSTDSATQPSYNLLTTSAQNITPTAATRPLEIRPGQIWQMSLELKSPRTLINPGGFDYETFAFRENIRALGTVRGTPQLLQTYQAGSWDTKVQAIRHDMREAMRRYLHDKRYGPVLTALVMGDQSSIAPEDWELFNRTGMTHLVSISGSHITMLSSMVFLVFMWLWPYAKWRGKPLADRQVGLYWAGGLGVVVALLYCLLAGWGIPAQRTFLMLGLFYLCGVLRLAISSSSLFALVALIVLLLDPWAILAPGFYLSFAAVAVLRHLIIQLVIEAKPTPKPVPKSTTKLANKSINNSAPASTSSPKGAESFISKTITQNVTQLIPAKSSFIQNTAYKLKVWWRVQLLITLVLSPFLLIFFNQISLISPLVNAYAILIIGAIVTPMALFLALLAIFSPFHTFNQWWADSCHTLLELTMRLSEFLASFPWASLSLPGGSLWTLGLALFGVLCFVLPKGLPFKPLAPLFLIPAFLMRPVSIAQGEWQLWALDLGQASAVLVRTAKHTLIFDTGVKTHAEHDSATRVIIPSLNYLGTGTINALVVSHTDSDHSGGFLSLISQWPVQHAYASFRLDDFLQAEEQKWAQEVFPKISEMSYQACQSGHEFTWDGVHFRFMFPEPVKTLPARAGNERSCVLLIQGHEHSALLTGDILREQEETYDWPKVDLVVAAHHGSSSSSSEHFIAQTQAQHVIAQAGYGNRYAHPHRTVVNRWLKSGTTFWNTATQGAILVKSNYRGLGVEALREKKTRYWHGR